MEDCRINSEIQALWKRGLGQPRKKMKRSVGDVTSFLASFVKKKIRSYFLITVLL
jgi:hypothetical protein